MLTNWGIALVIVGCVAFTLGVLVGLAVVW